MPTAKPLALIPVIRRDGPSGITAFGFGAPGVLRPGAVAPQRAGLDGALVAVALVAIAGLWIVTTERIRHEHDNAAADAWRQATNLAIAAEQHANATFGDVEQTLALVIREYELHGAPPALQQLFANGAIASGLYNLLVVTDEGGNVIATSSPVARFNVADRDYFAYHRDHPGDAVYIGRSVSGRATRNTIVPITRRIDKPDGTFAGVAVASVDPDYFAASYAKFDVGSNGVVGLVGVDGFARVRRVGDVREHGTDLRDSAFYRELQQRPVGTVLGPGRLDGARRYISFRTLERYPIVVQVGLDERDVLADFELRRSIYVIASAAATLVFAVIAVLFVAAARRQRRANEQLLQNEARFRATFDQAAVGISHVALDGRFLRANARFCQMHGYTKDELPNLTVFDTTHADDRPNLETLGRTLLDSAPGRIAPQFEKRNVRKDGSTIWVSIAVALVRDTAGKPDYFATMVEDITVRKAAEERYRATFNQPAVGIAHTTVDGCFLRVNDKLADMLGYTPSELLTMAIADVTVPAGLHAAFEARRQAIAERVESSVLETECVRKDGSRGWLMRSLSPVYDAGGNVDYCISIVQDITERKRAEAALKQSNEQFEQLVNHIQQVFFIVDVQRSELVYLSPAYERLCGVRFDSLASAARRWIDTVHADDRERALQRRDRHAQRDSRRAAAHRSSGRRHPLGSRARISGAQRRR